MPAGIVPRRRHEPYHYYLRASLVVALTVGWLLGAIELCAIAFHGAFQEAAARLISPVLFQVHGQSQIVGWVGLFIMGISYQVIPRQRRVAIHTPALAYVVLGLMLAGIGLRAISQPLAAGSQVFGGLLVLSAVLELAALAMFMVGLIKGRVMAESIEGPERFSRAALQWFALALLLNLAATIYLAVSGGALVPDWLDRPLLTIELFGFVLSMIFGVNARNLPLFMKVQPARGGSLRPVQRLFTPAVLLAAGGQAVTVMWPVAGRSLALAGWAGLAVCGVLYVRAVGLLSPRSSRIPTGGQSGWYEAYVRAAYIWLGVSLLLMVATAAAELAAVPFPTMDLFLAGLHGVTVGFVSTMIMGMAARIVPAFAATTLHSRSLLIGTWWCVVGGTLLRVPSQALYTAAGGPFVPLLGVSGVVQLAALALFAWNLWRTLDTSATEPAVAAGRPPVTGREAVTRAGG